MSKVLGKYLLETEFKTNTATGNGSTTAFNLTNTPIGIHALWVYLNGLFQTPTTDFSLSGATVTFSTAPANTKSIVFRYIKKD